MANTELQFLDSTLLSKLQNGRFIVPEVIVFSDINFNTELLRTNLNVYYVGDEINDFISSIIIISGYWQFYKDFHYETPVGPVLGPGYYNWVEAVGIPNDSISSFKCVDLVGF